VINKEQSDKTCKQSEITVYIIGLRVGLVNSAVNWLFFSLSSRELLEFWSGQEPCFWSSSDKRVPYNNKQERGDTGVSPEWWCCRQPDGTEVPRARRCQQPRQWPGAGKVSNLATPQLAPPASDSCSLLWGQPLSLPSLGLCIACLGHSDLCTEPAHAALSPIPLHIAKKTLGVTLMNKLICRSAELSGCHLIISGFELLCSTLTGALQ